MNVKRSSRKSFNFDFFLRLDRRVDWGLGERGVLRFFDLLLF